VENASPSRSSGLVDGGATEPFDEARIFIESNLSGRRPRLLRGAGDRRRREPDDQPVRFRTLSARRCERRRWT
jgi:hypothetical protein